MFAYISKSIRLFLPVVAIILIVVELIVTNQLAGLRRDVQSVDANTLSLQAENDLLSQKIASASALATISEKALTLGFRQPQTADYMTLGQEYVAVHFPPQFESSGLAGQAAEPR